MSRVTIVTLVTRMSRVCHTLLTRMSHVSHAYVTTLCGASRAKRSEANTSGREPNERSEAHEECALLRETQGT